MMEEWNEFAQKCLPANCGVVQRLEMRRAFYAGGQAVLSVVTANYTATRESTDADIERAEQIFRELEQFWLSEQSYA